METPLKRCTQCGNDYPATTSYFHADKRRPNGLGSLCKSCGNAARKRYYLANREEVIRRQLAYDELHLKEKNERNRKWRERNRDYVQAKYKEWRESHLDYLLKYNREYHQAHRAQLLEDMKRRYLQNRHLRLEQVKEYHRTHREQRVEGMRRYYIANRGKMNEYFRRRNQAKRASGQVTPADTERQYQHQNGLCYWCSQSLDGVYHIDHVIPLSRGGIHDPSNIALACPSCNKSKWSKLAYDEWTPPNPLKDSDVN